MFPTLVGGTFKIFDCTRVGNTLWLHVDLEEPCYSGRHLTIAWLLGGSQLCMYVVGLPLLMLWFLVRNQDRLGELVVKRRYGLYYGGYKEERFYWEIILSIRKISMIGLGVFGTSLGPIRQSILALLILLMCIILEIFGRPFETPTPRHRVLPHLELSALIVEWMTMWSGIMIFASIDAGNEDVSVSLSVFVVLIISGMMAWLVIQLVKECGFENRENAVVMQISTRVSKMRKSGLASVKARSRTIGKNGDDGGEGSSKKNKTWQPVNPMLKEHVEVEVEAEEKKKSRVRVAGMEPPPKAPVRRSSQQRTRPEQQTESVDGTTTAAGIEMVETTRVNSRRQTTMVTISKRSSFEALDYA